MLRIYPTNAARKGTTTLTGNGSANDIFTLSYPSKITVQNNTAATVYVAVGTGASSAATQGDEAVPAGVEFNSIELATWVAIYAAPGVSVNGTTSGGLVVYGVE